MEGMLDVEGIDLHRALAAHFGYTTFRPGQEAILRSVLGGRPTIAILPTGGGKSLCYQLPALLLPGTTVVASPLVALMKDQVDALLLRGVAATLINSSLGEAERQERQAALRRGAYRLVYVAPERFRSSSFCEAVAEVRVPLFAIDEAHCISSWGHDFRPDYLRLGEAREHLRAERVLALTATATPEVRSDIARALRLAHPEVFVAGFDRPNLFMEVAPAAGDAEKLGRILALARRGGSGLVYAATRRHVEKVMAALRANGIDALGYHAGMEDAARSAVQDRFLRGEAQLVVATTAFGMGVDKPDIRFVAHFDVPRSLEAYYQEIGRAGRDGERSLALLLFNFADVLMLRRMIDGSHPGEELVKRVWEEARRAGEGAASAIAAALGVKTVEVQSALKLLEAAGVLERARGRIDGRADFVILRETAPQELDLSRAAARVAHERRMLDRMVRFADARGCRRSTLLRYFGDPQSPLRCAACDLCAGPLAPPAEELRRAVPARRASRAEVDFVLEEMEEEVFASLRALRTELAREGRVPPYVIFHDATLRELARALPQDEASFLAVKGAGPGRWQRYGERVLRITAPAAARRQATSECRDATPGAALASTPRS